MQKFDYKEFQDLTLPTESEIMMSWQGELSQPVVSLVCITYNQEKYIRDTIKGFLIQKTIYPFEIVIHDDASTDKTAEIIKEYCEKYPAIIRPIFQKENQYSKGKKITPIAVEYAVGEYIALCEGDDFWIDEHKVQDQLSVLISNHFSSSFSPAITNYNKLIGYHGKKNKKINTSDLLLRNGDVIPTGSLMFNRAAIARWPDFFDSLPVGDYYLQLLISMHGDIFYHAKVYSFYRLNSLGSWSSARCEMSEQHIIEELKNYLKANEVFFDFIGVSPDKPNSLTKLNACISLIKIKKFSFLKEHAKDVNIYFDNFSILIRTLFVKAIALFVI